MDEAINPAGKLAYAAKLEMYGELLRCMDTFPLLLIDKIINQRNCAQKSYDDNSLWTRKHICSMDVNWLTLRLGGLCLEGSLNKPINLSLCGLVSNTQVIHLRQLWLYQL